MSTLQTILGIDPSLRSTGYGIIAKRGSEMQAVTYGVIKNSPLLSQSQCLIEIHKRIGEVIAEHKPDMAAVEGVIHLQNYQTAILLGAARGASLLALAEADIPTYEYAPRRVKSASTGRGGAEKSQVAFMIRSLLKLKEEPPHDAADALAIALTHAQHNQTIKPAKRI